APATAASATPAASPARTPRTTSVRQRARTSRRAHSPTATGGPVRWSVRGTPTNGLAARSPGTACRLASGGEGGTRAGAAPISRGDPYRLAGTDRAYDVPAVTHLSSGRSVATSSPPTRSQ